MSIAHRAMRYDIHRKNLMYELWSYHDSKRNAMYELWSYYDNGFIIDELRYIISSMTFIMTPMMMMKKVSHDDGYSVMKVIPWWNLSRDESNLVMKVMIVKELMTGDVSPVAMFFQKKIIHTSKVTLLKNRLTNRCQ